ncbi:MAG TPA: HAD family hydrolase [Candidatus Binatia bacterium]|nr:HAD family hydrolase [Candidatus Binatia bacterium]
MTSRQRPQPRSRSRVASPRNVAKELVFLFDVDNTLLDNDRIQNDLFGHISREFGRQARQRYLEIFEELRSQLGYADYLGALERYRLEKLHDPRFLCVSNWLIEYPFARRLYPGALAVIKQCRRWGQAAILSDGDAVFQPRKVERSGLWRAFAGNVMIFIHKEQELECVEQLYPVKHYVMVDDKLRLLEAIRNIWKERVTTVFVRQGHYARDRKAIADYRPADISIRRIADLLQMKRTDFLGARAEVQS